MPEPRFRAYAARLALLGAQRVFPEHDGLFATTVREPFCNRTALPFLRVTGFEQVGTSVIRGSARSCRTCTM